MEMFFVFVTLGMIYVISLGSYIRVDRSKVLETELDSHIP